MNPAMLSDFAQRLAAGVSIPSLVTDVGYPCSTNKETFKYVLRLNPAFDEATLAHLLTAVARTHVGLDTTGVNFASLCVAMGTQPPETASLTTWNVEAIVDAILETRPGLSWPGAMGYLDHEAFQIPDQTAFLVFMTMYRRATSEPFPIGAIAGGIWANSSGQLSFLRFAAIAPPEIFSWAHSMRRQLPLEGLPGRSPTGTPNHAWLSLDLLQCLALLAEADHLAEMRTVLDVPLKQCPELLLLGMACTRTEYNVLANEVFSVLMPGILSSHQASAPVLQRLWQVNREVILRAMVDLHNQDPGTLLMSFTVCTELKILTDVIQLTPASFSLDLAALAARREYLDLDKWLTERVAARDVVFVENCLRFLRLKTGPERSGVLLTAETATQFFRVLMQLVPQTMPELAEELSRLCQQALASPQGRAPGPADAAAAQPGAVQQESPFSKEIEDEANGYFQKIYGGHQTIAEVVEMLKAFQQGNNKHERDVFGCMVHNLFDEYRFFHKYPDKELRITSLFFGAIVQRGLVTGQALWAALRFVLDGVRKPPGTKLHAFGMDALNEFKGRLAEWPQFCQSLLAVPHVRASYPDLVRFLEQALAAAAAAAAAQQQQLHGPGGAEQTIDQQMEGLSLERWRSDGPVAGGQMDPSVLLRVGSAPVGPGGIPTAQAVGGYAPSAALPHAPSLGVGIVGGPQGGPGDHGQGGGAPSALQAMHVPSAKLEPSAPAFNPAPSFAMAKNIDTLLQAAENHGHVVPDDTIVDKIHFICNNLSANNLDAKARDVKQRLQEQFWPWFSTYLVVKRASIEPNFHHLYTGLLDQLSEPAIFRLVLQSSLANVKVLLRTDKIKTSSSERSLLKNLGAWLGALTIQRNRPVRMRDLDLKALLWDAFSSGRMIAVIPFVAKVLEPCKGNRVFAPPNPWSVAVLSLIAEIYTEKDLKLNLKFEVERLFKHLDLQLKDFPISSSLAGLPRNKLDNPDFVQERPAAGAPGGLMPSASTPSMDAQQAAQAAAAAAAAAGASPLGGISAQGTGSLPSLEKLEAAVLQHQAAQAAQAQAPQPPPQQPFALTDQPLLANLQQYCVLPREAPFAMLAERLGFKRLLPLALERAIREIVAPVVERSVSIACMTTRELALKDFAVEPDAERLRKGAHLMVSALAGSLALVTCKEPLRLSAAQQLRALLQQAGAPNVAEAAVLEQTVQQATADNLELGCALIEKAATDKAVRDIDEQLAQAYRQRTEHRDRTRGSAPFYDLAYVYGRYPGNLPESLRPKVQPPAQALRVYEDFAKLPRPPAAPAPAGGAGGRYPGGGYPDADPLGAAAAALGGTEPLTTQAVVERFRAAMQRLDAAIAAEPAQPFEEAAPDSEARQAVGEVREALGAAAHREDAGLAVAQKAFRRLHEKAGPLACGAHLAVLDACREANKRLAREVTAWWMSVIDDDMRCARGPLEGLIRSRLLAVPEIDGMVAKLVQAGRQNSLDAAVRFISASCLVDPPVCPGADVPHTLEVLAKAAARGGPNSEQLLQLVEMARSPRPAALAAGPAAGVRRPVDPPQIREAVAQHLEEWARVCDAPAGDALYTSFFSGLAASGMLTGAEAQERTFRILVELAVAHCLASENPHAPGSLNFAAVDAVARLVMLLTRHFPEAAGAPPSQALRLGLLRRVLDATVSTLLRDADERGATFNPRPYFRLFSLWLHDLNLPDSALDSRNAQVLAALASSLMVLMPLRVPGFAFAWLELVSSRAFLPRLLSEHNRKGWPLVQRLLTAVLRFLEPYLRNAELSEPVRLLYKGALRVLLVLLHDFPEFLCDHHFALCDAIPPTCIQMRNLVLSAFPRNMRLPDPFTPNLKVDLLPEISASPRLPEDAFAALKGAAIRTDVDAYLKTRAPNALPADLRARLLLPPAQALAAGTRYNVPLLNALVLYIGCAAIAASRKEASGPLGHSAPLEVFQRLANELDAEGRYLFLNAVANQLRYPNNHTHYFSCVLLFLFAEAQSEVIQEQITRVLLERLIVNRPHPWGLLITFIELIKNPRYNFWAHSFTRCAPEIEKLFEFVARSCMGSSSGSGRPASDDPETAAAA